jgi:hypothetical protein
MAAETKTPLQAVVRVICDCLHNLSTDDKARALEAARIALGLRAPVEEQAQRGFARLPGYRSLRFGNRLGL